MSALFLTNDELVALTGYRRPGRQAVALAKMGIPYQTNPRGRVLVVRAAVEGREEGARVVPEWQPAAVYGKSA